MGVKFEFTVENSQVMKKLSKMMEMAKAESNKTPEDLCQHWASNISYFLFKRSKEHEHPQDWYLNQLPVFKNWKITSSPKSPSKGRPKDPNGRYHVLKEVQKRSNHRTFLSSGWLRVKKIVGKKGTKLISGTNVNGKVDVRRIPTLIGSSYSVTITNLSPKAHEFHQKNGITEQALEDERLDLAQYLAMKRKTTVEKILNE
jgi:hypothetical protein